MYLLAMPKYDTNLHDYLQNCGNAFNMNKRFQMILKILEALDYIHQQKQCHLDIKPSNIFLNLQQNQWDEKNCVLADFGLSCRIGVQQTRAGTPGFASPEQCSDKADDR